MKQLDTLAVKRVRKAMRKPLRIEYEQRVRAAYDLLLSGAKDGDIKRRIAEDCDLSPRTVERYLRHARVRLLEETQRPAEEHRANAMAFYRALADDLTVAPLVRLKAQERIDKLLGLEVMLPRRIEHTGADGGPIRKEGTVTVVHVDLSAKLAEYQSSIRSAAIANASERQLPTNADDIVIPPAGS